VANDLVLLGTRERGNEAQLAADKAEKAKPTAPAARPPEISDCDLPF